MRKLIALSTLFFIMMIFSSVNLAQQSTPTPEPTETPAMDDLQNQELLTVITELLQPNEDCQLPCFWGFVSGTSTISDIEDFWTTTFETPITTTLADDGRIFASFWTDFVPQNGYTDISILMTFRDEILSLLQVTTFNTSIWLEDGWLSLSNVLQELPDGTEFFIGVRIGSVILFLVNTDANIIIQRSYQLRIRSNTLSPDSTEPLLLCPTTDNLTYTSIWFLDDEAPISIEETIGNPIFVGNDLAVYQPVEFMTNLSPDEFSEFIQQDSGDCVEMLSYSELLELGYSF